MHWWWFKALAGLVDLQPTSTASKLRSFKELPRHQQPTPPPTYPATNLTHQIVAAASAGSYAVGAFNWSAPPHPPRHQSNPASYETDGVLAVIRAAEANHSPAIIQLFPGPSTSMAQIS